LLAFHRYFCTGQRMVAVISVLTRYRMLRGMNSDNFGEVFKQAI
jgi:hypothetical protein